MPALVLVACVHPGCGRDAVVIDRAFLRGLPEQPTDRDLSGRFDALRYLVATGDSEAELVVLRYVTSDGRFAELATTGCPCHNDEDLVAAAYREGLDGAFWTAIPRLSRRAQARAIVHFNYLSGRTDAGGMSLHPMVDYEGDRDEYLAAHPELARDVAEVEQALAARRVSSGPGVN